MGKVSGKALPLLSACLLLGAAVFVLNGLGTILGDISDEGRYVALAQEVETAAAKPSGGAEGQDAPALPEGCAAWLKVLGTSIDYPVAQAQEADPSFYLSHDLWGNACSSGCPYLDWRCGANNRQALVYAHRIGTTGRQFTPIADAWQQAQFDATGNLVWTTANGTEELQPLCALKVDKGYQRIQGFDASDATDLRRWLNTVLADSTARSSGAEALASRAKRAITLATCSSAQGGQRDRTLLVFVA